MIKCVMNEKFLKPYDPKETEDAIYKKAQSAYMIKRRWLFSAKNFEY